MKTYWILPRGDPHDSLVIIEFEANTAHTCYMYMRQPLLKSEPRHKKGRTSNRSGLCSISHYQAIGAFPVNIDSCVASIVS